MSKKRTRREKENAHHNFSLNWNPDLFEAGVKRQKNIGHEAKIDQLKSEKSADILAQLPETKAIKGGIVKSLILVSLVLCLELVIYLLGA